MTDYRERLSRVQAYIHDHLDQPLDLARLAEVAHLSPYHWHRVYHALYGETIAAHHLRKLPHQRWHLLHRHLRVAQQKAAPRLHALAHGLGAQCGGDYAQ